MSRLPAGFRPVREDDLPAGYKPVTQVIEETGTLPALESSEAVTEAPMPSQVPSQTPQQPEVGIGNQLIQNITEARAEREREVVKTMEDYAKGEINLAEAGIQVVGKGGAGAALDVAGAGIEAGLAARKETGVLPAPIALGMKAIGWY